LFIDVMPDLIGPDDIEIAGQAGNDDLAKVSQRDLGIGQRIKCSNALVALLSGDDIRKQIT